LICDKNTDFSYSLRAEEVEKEVYWLRVNAETLEVLQEIPNREKAIFTNIKKEN